ncbi:MAG TPA: methyltransferase [Pirellulaceae bacterium]|nr:methyltransferase [Pirellulaceae bacterium]HMO90792.1 methyltransferase [Pirellulaceae bacterium]HMP68043.1 methyltransferase [Pirellulaceae bacterium]
MKISNQRSAIHPSESALIQVLGEEPAQRVWTTSLARGLLPRKYAEQFPEAEVLCLILDRFVADLVEADSKHSKVGAFKVWCHADWPSEHCQLAMLPMSGSGEAALAEDLIQGAFQGLEIGGRLLVSIPRRSEHWIREILRPFNKQIRVTTCGETLVARIDKRSELKRAKHFWCDVVFRDHGRLIKLQTRPGVFANRKLDQGARQLLNFVELNSQDQRILDIGCGSGAVGLGLALRKPDLHVVAVDSNPRAIDCTQRNFELNKAGALETILNHGSELKLEQPVDLVVANPPYFSNYRIAEIFCELAAANLRPAGRVFFVAKKVHWYEDNFPRWFSNTNFVSRGGYWLISGKNGNK